jgi:multidrug resistance efflux pump
MNVPLSSDDYPFAMSPFSSSRAEPSSLPGIPTPKPSTFAFHSPDANRPSQSSSPVPSPAPLQINFDALYVELSGASSRAVAVVKMVEWLAKALPGLQVRCGIGTSRLKSFFDARLGWLGAESTLQRTVAENWTTHCESETGFSVGDSQVVIRLEQKQQRNVAILCLAGDRIPGAVFEQLCGHAATISAILWSRPLFALPVWSATRGRPRMAIFAAACMLMLLLVWPANYRAACTVRVEPIGARAVSSPFQAILESVFVEPGDEVTQGQLLVVLDGGPLRLEQQSIDAEYQQSLKQQDVALAAGKVAEAQLAQFKCQQLRRQRDLIERRLGQLNITSPIEGVVVSGDLRHAIGSPLETGQVLLEVAPLDRMVIEVEIPEEEIGLVKDDSPVQFRVDSARVGTVDTNLARIYPSAQLREEASVFIAPIEIENESRQYRPGMRGKATVYGPIRPWAWSHLRGPVEQATWLLGF